MTKRVEIFTLLTAGAFLCGSVLLLPNGADPRIQRMLLFTLSVTSIMAVLIFITLDRLTGALAMYAAFIVTQSYARPTEYMICALMIFYAVWCWTYDNDKTDRARDTILDCIIILALANFAFQMLHWQGVNWYHFPRADSTGHIPGLMGNHGETSQMYAVALPAFFRKSRWQLIPIAVIGLYLCNERVGICAVALMVCFFCLRWTITHLSLKQAIICIPIIAWIVGLGIFVSTASRPLNIRHFISDRGSIWASSMRIAAVKPLMGWGFNQYEYVIPFITSMAHISDADKEMAYSQIHDVVAMNKAARIVAQGNDGFYAPENQHKGAFGQAHNEFVEWFFISGIVGLGLLLTVTANKLWLAYHQVDPIPFYGLLASCACAFFWFTWHLMPLMLLTLVYLGMVPRKAAIREGEAYA
jgi:hypothetical protein